MQDFNNNLPVHIHIHGKATYSILFQIPVHTFVFGYFSFNNEFTAFMVKVLLIFMLSQTGQNLILLHIIIVTVCLKLTKSNEQGLYMVVNEFLLQF